MSTRKYVLRFWTISDYLEEEIWLRKMHMQGWKFSKFTAPCFYTFESCEPEDVIYRLDYKNRTESDDYMRMVEDYGWEYAGKCLGWLYFRKPASQTENEGDGEIFSDNASRIGMVEHIVKTRLLPFAVIFLCCVIPNSINAFSGRMGWFFSIFWGIMFVLYVYIIIHCGLKLRRMREELEQ